MAIAKNFYNPIPLHDSQSQWYDCRKTFNGAHSHIFVPHNETLPFQITIGKDDITAPSKSCTLSVSTPVTGIQVGEYTGSIAEVRSNIFAIRLGLYGVYMEKRDSGYHVYYNTSMQASKFAIMTHIDLGASVSASVLEGFTMPISALTNSGTNVFYVYKVTNNVTYSKVCVMGIVGNMMFSQLSTSDYYVGIVDANTETESDITHKFEVFPQYVPTGYRSEGKYYTMFFDTADLTPNNPPLPGDVVLPIGTYYLHITINNVDYYSEPFEWIDDVSSLVYIRYRRTKPIVDTRNYIDFMSNGVEKYFKMYVQSEIMMPEFVDNEENVENDGYTFVEKIVSYKTHKFTCPMTEWYADAIRMVRHCNDITIMQNGEVYDVEYFAAPKISWDNSNHFCIVECGFNTDTIIQTNGESLDYMRGNIHGSFDDSFDSSFN